MGIKSCVSIMLSSLGVTEISDLKLATDLRLKLSYNCWEQMLESLDFGHWALQHRLIEWKVVKLLASEPNRKLELAGYAACPC